MTDSINRLTGILQGPSGLNTEIDYNLTSTVSQGLKSALKEIQDEGTMLKRTTNLIVKTSQFHQLQTKLLEFLHQVAREFENSDGRGLKLSSEQWLFYQQVIKTCIYHQTYLQLLTRRDVINQIYSRLSNSQLIRSNQIQEIETLLGSSETSNAQDYIAQITRTTSTTFANIKNLDSTIAAIQQTILLRPLALNASYTFIMLTGPPGTGKTSLARAISNFHSNGVYLNLDISALLGQYVGQTEKRISQLFDHVGQNRDKKFTIVMDELDIVLGDGAENSTYLTTLRNSLQVALDPDHLGPNLVIVGLTNYFNRLNDVIKRRATNTFYIPLPTFEESQKFLFNEIELPFYAFLAEVGSNVIPSPLSEAYKEEVSQVFRGYVNARFSNANMRNIAASASASAISRNNLFFDLTVNDRILKICLPATNAIIDLPGISSSVTSDLFSVSQEIKTNPNFYKFLFIVPSTTDIVNGINQTSFIDTAREEEFRLANVV